MRVDLVTRTDCHLCEEALASLRAAGVRPRLLDVDADPLLLDLYGWRVPVVLLDGEVAAEGRVSGDAVLAAMGATRP